MTTSQNLPDITIINHIADIFTKESGLNVKLEHIESNVLEADITDQGIFSHMFDEINVKCKVFRNKKNDDVFDFQFYLCWYLKNGNFNSVEVANITYQLDDYKFVWVDPNSKKCTYESS